MCSASERSSSRRHFCSNDPREMGYAFSTALTVAPLLTRSFIKCKIANSSKSLIAKISVDRTRKYADWRNQERRFRCVLAWHHPLQ